MENFYGSITITVKSYPYKITSVWWISEMIYFIKSFIDTVKPLKSGHLRVLKNLSVIGRCRLLGDNLEKIVTFGTKHFVRYSWCVHYLACPLLGGFTVVIFEINFSMSTDFELS